jgi:hypothetical protein
MKKIKMLTISMEKQENEKYNFVAEIEESLSSGLVLLKNEEGDPLLNAFTRKISEIAPMIQGAFVADLKAHGESQYENLETEESEEIKNGQENR